MNWSVAIYDWFYRTEYLCTIYTCKQFFNKQTLFIFLMLYIWYFYWGSISKRSSLTNILIYFFMFSDLRTVTRIPIWNISLNLFIYLIYIAIELRFYRLIYFQHLESRIWLCSLVHRIGFPVQLVLRSSNSFEERGSIIRYIIWISHFFFTRKNRFSIDFKYFFE